MRIRRAQAPDWVGLNELYRRNHPDAKRGLVRPGWRSQAFVAKDNGHYDAIMGFALASFGGLKARRRGAIHVLEIEPTDRDPLLERALTKVCVTWLEAQGCTSAQLPALSSSEYEWLLRELRAELGTSCFTIALTPRPPRWNWVLDPQTGMVYPEAGAAGTPPGPPPKPFQAARQVWN